MYRLTVLSSLFLAAALTGCATTQSRPDTSIKTSSIVAAEGSKHIDEAENTPVASSSGFHHLAGRTLAVSSLAELKLDNKEVILSFDDGPIPGRTDKVLATLDQFGVKGAFMMVGEMADAHPALARKVALDGNAIGSHTYHHPDLAAMGFDAAMEEVTKGTLAVTKATGEDVNFFRFPYLADSHKLRDAISMRDMIVMGADVDSKDYYNTTPVAVTQRIMRDLDRRGRGIILMHDIHKRTAIMLPTLLSKLEAEGYKVVTLKFKKTHTPEVLASS